MERANGFEDEKLTGEYKLPPDDTTIKIDRERRPQVGYYVRDVAPPSTSDSPRTPHTERKIEKGEERRGEVSERKSLRGRKPLKEHPKHVLTYRDVKHRFPQVFQALFSLSIYTSSEGHAMILLGREGYYSANRFRRAMFREGPLLMERIKSQVSKLEAAALDNLQEQGMVFASYDSLINYLIEQKFGDEELMHPLKPDDSGITG